MKDFWKSNILVPRDGRRREPDLIFALLMIVAMTKEFASSPLPVQESKIEKTDATPWRGVKWEREKGTLRAPNTDQLHRADSFYSIFCLACSFNIGIGTKMASEFNNATYYLSLLIVSAPPDNYLSKATNEGKGLPKHSSTEIHLTPIVVPRLSQSLCFCDPRFCCTLPLTESSFPCKLCFPKPPSVKITKTEQEHMEPPPRCGIPWAGSLSPGSLSRHRFPWFWIWSNDQKLSTNISFDANSKMLLRSASFQHRSVLDLRDLRYVSSSIGTLK